jgi:hypothetical protein
MFACTLYEHALLLRYTPRGTDAASAALAEAKAIAISGGMTRLLTVLDRQHEHAPGGLTLAREDGYWLLSYGSTLARLTDSLGLVYLHVLVSNPGQQIAAVQLAQLASTAQPAAAAAQADGLHQISGTGGGEILDPRARQEYRRRLTELDADLAGSARKPSSPGSTSPGPSGQRSPGSGTMRRTPPPTSTKPSGPDPGVPTATRARNMPDADRARRHLVILEGLLHRGRDKSGQGISSTMRGAALKTVSATPQSMKTGSAIEPQRVQVGCHLQAFHASRSQNLRDAVDECGGNPTPPPG